MLPAYDEAEIRAIIVPYLSYLHALGVRTIADATAMRFGRHPRCCATCRSPAACRS